jgi:hypothetical protein
MASAAITGCSVKFPKIDEAQITIPDGSIGSDHVTAVAGAEIVATKLKHLHKVGTNFALAVAATPVAREELVYVASAAGTINAFSAMLNDTGTATSCGFVLKKNGTTLMSSALNITNANTDRQVVDGVLTSSSYVAGDVFSIQLTVSSSTGAQGAFAWLEMIETVG